MVACGSVAARRRIPICPDSDAMMTKTWIQFLLVAVPVTSLIGSWLALRVVGDRLTRKKHAQKTELE